MVHAGAQASPEGPGAVPRRGRGGGPAAAPQHRPGPRRGAARRLRRSWCSSWSRGASLARADRRHAAAGPTGRRAGRDAGAGHPRGAPAGGRAPRPDAGQHPADRRRHAQDHRLRPGQAAHRRRGTPHPDRRVAGHAQLHGARAGGQPAPRRSGRRPTSTPWGRSSTSCSPAGRRSRRSRPWRPCARWSPTSRSLRRGCGPSCPAIWRRSA